MAIAIIHLCVIGFIEIGIHFLVIHFFFFDHLFFWLKIQFQDYQDYVK